MVRRMRLGVVLGGALRADHQLGGGLLLDGSLEAAILISGHVNRVHRRRLTNYQVGMSFGSGESASFRGALPSGSTPKLWLEFGRMLGH